MARLASSVVSVLVCVCASVETSTFNLGCQGDQACPIGTSSEIVDEVMLLQQSISHDDVTGSMEIPPSQWAAEHSAAQKSDSLARNVFLFWDQGWSADGAPEYVLANALSWKAQNPTWTVHMLDGSNETLAKYFNQSLMDVLWIQKSLQFKSDLVRTFALAEHGGVYADADVLCAKPLDEYIDKKMVAGFYAFRQIELGLEQGPKRLSSWFLASKRGGYIISRMAASLRENWGTLHMVDFASQHEMYTYYRWHYTFSHLLDVDSRFEELWKLAPHCRWSDYSCFDKDCLHAPCVHKYKVYPTLTFSEFKQDVDQGCSNVYKTDYHMRPKSWVDYVTYGTEFNSEVEDVAAVK